MFCLDFEQWRPYGPAQHLRIAAGDPRKGLPWTWSARSSFKNLRVFFVYGFLFVQLHQGDDVASEHGSHGSRHCFVVGLLMASV